MSPNSRAYRDAWARVRAAIKDELVDANAEYPEGWSGGWQIPTDDRSADAMLDDIARTATRVAFGIEDEETA